MDYKTKAYYRNKIKEISKRTKISEIYITQKALELSISNVNTIETYTKESAKTNSEKQSHIGYYLIDEGISELYKTLQTSKKPKKEKRSVSLYILSITIITILISVLIYYYVFKQTNPLIGIIIFLLTIIPSSQIATDIVQYLLNKIVKPKLIPKMDFSNRNTRRMHYYGYNS